MRLKLQFPSFSRHLRQVTTESFRRSCSDSSIKIAAMAYHNPSSVRTEPGTARSEIDETVQVHQISTKHVSNQPSATKELSPEELEKQIWEKAHREAVANNQRKYIDPKTGYIVMTELAHTYRNFCCANRCRHCPYNHVLVGASEEVKKAAKLKGTAERKERDAERGKPVWGDIEDDFDY